MHLRKTINTLHLWLGLISGSILLIVAVTGCMLAFEDEIRNTTEHHLLYVAPKPGPQLGVQDILASMHSHYPKAVTTQLRYFGDNSKAVQCYTKDKKIYAINPYNGQVLGYRDQQRDFMYVVLSLHRTLLLGHIGEEIIFWNACIFLVMLLSGLFLWWPRRLKQLRQAITIKKNTSAKRRNYDLHSVGGFYALIPLLFIVITGIDMASGSAKEPKKKSAFAPGIVTTTGIYDRALQQAYHGEPIEVLRVTLPKDSRDVLSVSIRYQTSSLRKQTVFIFDQYSGKLLATDNWQKKTSRERFFGSDYEIHTGRILGLPGKIVMFLAAMTAASLPITGFLIWRGKRRKQAKKTASSRTILAN